MGYELRTPAPNQLTNSPTPPRHHQPQPWNKRELTKSNKPQTQTSSQRDTPRGSNNPTIYHLQPPSICNPINRCHRQAPACMEGPACIGVHAQARSGLSTTDNLSAQTTGAQTDRHNDLQAQLNRRRAGCTTVTNPDPASMLATSKQCK